MSTPTIIVAGLGRCGTTMLMTMLAAVGVPTIGTAPDYEDVDNLEMLERDPKAWAESIQGRAVKLLEAHRYALPDLPGAKLIWLVRHPRQQARSMLKLLKSAFSSVSIDRGSIRAMQKGICRDTTRACRALDHVVGDGVGMALVFEDILKDPAASARMLCQYLGLPDSAAETMAAQVWKRDPACLPYMAELAL